MTAFIRKRGLRKLVLLLLVGTVLQGCAEAIVVGGAAALVSYYDRRSIRSQISDQAIELRISKVLHKDSELADKGRISATSYNASVLLLGEVPSQELKDRVLNLVQAVKGVKRLHNEIIVTPARSSEERSQDGSITRRVKSRLFVKDIDATRVKVVTEKGNVYLMGLVTRKEAEEITQVTGQTKGVRSVIKYFEYID